MLLSTILLLLGVGLGAPEPVLAASVVSQCAEFRAQFPQVRFYVEARGGFGDVVAGLSSALALAEQCPPEFPVEVVGESEETMKALDVLSLQMGDRLSRHLRILKSHPGLGPASLEIHAATASLEDQNSPFKTNPDSVVLYAPVFSDSESLKKKDRVGQMIYRGQSYRTSVPGPGRHELGVYSDSAAARVAGMDENQLRRFLIFQSGRERIFKLIPLLEKNVRLGFAYGVGLGFSSTESYFLGYLKSLRTLVGRKGPVVLLTPARVRDRVQGWLRSGMLPDNAFEVLDLKNIEEGWSPSPEKITVIETRFVSPELFAGLMAYSAAKGVVPMGAGDGFLSAALALGIPFVMNQMYHNTDVIKSYVEHFETWLERADSPARREVLSGLLREIYAPSSLVMDMGFSDEHVVGRMSLSQELAQFKPEFAFFSRTVDQVLIHWMENALFVKKFGGAFFDEAASLPVIGDRILQEEVLRSVRKQERSSEAVSGTAEDSDSAQLSFFSRTGALPFCERLLTRTKPR